MQEQFADLKEQNSLTEEQFAELQEKAERIMEFPWYSETGYSDIFSVEIKSEYRNKEFTVKDNTIFGFEFIDKIILYTNGVGA